jgi:hypothetical protein
VSYRPDTPFDSIESAHEYARLLEEVIAEAKHDIATDLAAASGATADRRLEAQRLIHYKLERLEQHLHHSSRLLNDLRSLRRLLFDERMVAVGAAGADHRASGKSEAA